MTDLARLEPPVKAKLLAPKPKVLTLDIETSPNLAHVWSLWNQNVGLAQLRESGEVISFSAKWYGKPPVFFSNFHDGHDEMVAAAWELINEADVVVHYNGKSFDIKHLKREFLLAGMAPPLPHKDVDLLEIVKSTFRFPSNKLDYVSQQLGLGKKTSHEGHELWVKCLAGDPKAWARMKRYNIQDVRLTEQLYDVLRPWIRTHPHLVLDPDNLLCNHCGSDALTYEGEYLAVLLTYQIYRCGNCRGLVRANTGTRVAKARGL